MKCTLSYYKLIFCDREIHKWSGFPFLEDTVVSCARVCKPWMYVVSEGVRKEHQILWNCSYKCCGLTRGYWKPNPGPLKKQHKVLVTAEPSPLWFVCFVLFGVICLHSVLGELWFIDPPDFTLSLFAHLHEYKCLQRLEKVCVTPWAVVTGLVVCLVRVLRRSCKCWDRWVCASHWIGIIFFILSWVILSWLSCWGLFVWDSNYSFPSPLAFLAF